MPDDATAALWLTVVAIGAYHGLNPAMGWPLAVANGLTEKRERGRVRPTLLPLGAGHFLAMALVLVPFAMLVRTDGVGAGDPHRSRRCWCCCSASCNRSFVATRASAAGADPARPACCCGPC